MRATVRFDRLGLTGRAALLAGIVTGFAACAPQNVQSVVVSQQVSVVLVNAVGAPAKPAIDGSDPRIVENGRAIAELLGHPLRYEIDAALARQLDSGLHHVFVAAMEETVEGLTAARKRKPDAFAVAAPALEAIGFEYAAVARDGAPAFDLTTGTYRVVEGPDRSALLGGWDVISIIDDVFDATMTARYAARAPESIAPAEQRTYVDYVVHHAAPRPARDADQAGARIATLVRLYDHVADATLRDEVRRDVLVQAKSFLPGIAKAAPPEAAAAEPVRGALVAWVNARAGDWSPADRTAVADAFFSDREAKDDPVRRGFDDMRFARPVVAAFAKAVPPEAGHEGQNIIILDGSDASRLVDQVICPYHETQSTLSTWTSCTGALYRDILSAPDGARRMAAWLVEAQSDRFTQTAVLNVLMAKGATSAMAVVDALMSLETTPRATIAALHALASFSDRGGRRDPPLDLNAIVARALAWYKERPALRGPLLFVLTQLGRDEDTRLNWGHLPELLGAPLNAGEYGAFLDQSPRAMADVDLLTKGLGPGWSRSAVILPRYERLLDGRKKSGVEPYEITERLVRSLCDDGTHADVQALQVFLRARIEGHPAENTLLANFANSTPALACPAANFAVTSEKPVAPVAPGTKPVLFGN
jgi:hypothetical protein